MFNTAEWLKFTARNYSLFCYEEEFQFCPSTFANNTIELLDDAIGEIAGDNAFSSYALPLLIGITIVAYAGWRINCNKTEKTRVIEATISEKTGEATITALGVIEEGDEVEE